MTRAASPTPAPKKPRPIPGRIGAVLTVLAALVAHARHFIAGAATYVEAPEFASAAGVFGTYQLPVILHRMQRGILRALALRDYLLARAARGRDLRFIRRPYLELQPHHLPPPKPARAPREPRTPRQPRRPEPALLDADDPASCHLPTPEEFAAEVRSRPIGRTISYICLDLGVFPALCNGAFWNHVDRAMRGYGGSLSAMYRVRARREKSFWRERDARPETWHINWRDFRPATVRRALGCRIGEALAEGPLPVGRMPAWDARGIAVEAARENTGPLVPVPS